MAKNRTKVYWIFLLFLVYMGSIVLGIGQTQARYNSTAASTTFVETKSVELVSDCMVREGDPAVTVLLGELHDVLTVSFWLKSVGADATGEFAWGVSDPEGAGYADLLNISLTPYEGADPFSGEVLLTKDMKMDLLLTIRPDERARNAAHGELKINVIVTWGEEMWGTFQVILPEVVSEENIETPEENIPEETEPIEDEEPSMEEKMTGEDTGAVQAESSEDQEEIQPEVENTEENGNLPTDLQNEGVSDTEQDPAPVENMENPVELTDAEDPASDAGADGNPEDGTSGDSEAVLEEDLLRLKTLPRFDPDEMLPVYLRVSDDITSVHLGRWSDEEGIQPFPDRTRISLDGGNSFYVMYEGYSLKIMMQDLIPEENTSGETQSGKETTLLLDFRYADLKKNQKQYLVMRTYCGSDFQEQAMAETIPNAKSFSAEVIPDTADSEVIPGEEIRFDKLILNRDACLELTFPQEWTEQTVSQGGEEALLDLAYSAEILTMTDAGTLMHQEVELTEEALWGTYTHDDKEHKLELKIGEKLPLAGTYRLNINWNYKGICFQKTQTTFFINYSAYLDRDLSSQGV